ncbi:MAG: hypothetical protein CMO81_03200 [Waddliaceae bacterium]|nr:hypothetical protein [Waddliaceae bacterium]
MASIYKRKSKTGTGHTWKADVRLKGHPSVTASFPRKQEADDWARETEYKIRQGLYNFGRKDRNNTFEQLIKRYVDDGVLEHHKASKDTLRHLDYFTKRLGSYALVHLTPEKLLQERKYLQSSLTNKGTPRNPATINRYMSSLGGLLSYAHRNLRWIDENPCSGIIKLKENPKKKRVLKPEEEIRLLKACRESKANYLYCLVLLAITTGARQGELLSLQWDDIDFDNRLAYIRTSKNDRPRTVGLVHSVADELKLLHSNRDPQKTLVFASKTAFGRLDPKKAFQGALVRAGIEDFQFHGLRHHYCTAGGHFGASGGQLRAQLGHSTSSMTDHYSHLDAESTRFIGEAIEKRLNRGDRNDN